MFLSIIRRNNKGDFTDILFNTCYFTLIYNNLTSFNRFKKMELNGSQSESAKYYLPLSTYEPKQGSFEENEKVKSASKYLNMKETDPDWQFAHNHGCAARPGIAREGEMDDVCICCLRSINKDPIPLCENSK